MILYYNKSNDLSDKYEITRVFTFTVYKFFNILLFHFIFWVKRWMYWFYSHIMCDFLKFFFCLSSLFRAVKILCLSTFMAVSGYKMDLVSTLRDQKSKGKTVIFKQSQFLTKSIYFFSYNTKMNNFITIIIILDIK